MRRFVVLPVAVGCNFAKDFGEAAPSSECDNVGNKVYTDKHAWILVAMNFLDCRNFNQDKALADYLLNPKFPRYKVNCET